MTAPDGPVAAPVPGVDEAEWDKLVERGRSTGEVHADQVSHVLRHVELSETVLTDVHDAMAGAGIAIDDKLDDDHHDSDDSDDDDTPVGTRREVLLESVPEAPGAGETDADEDRKSTRLNSSHPE